MNTNMKELNMNEMELVNGGWSWKNCGIGAVAGAVLGAAGGALAGGWAGAAICGVAGAVVGAFSGGASDEINAAKKNISPIPGI